MKTAIPLATALFLATFATSYASDAGRYIGPDPSAPGWERIDPESWKPNKAANPGELVGALLARYMETTEGRPNIKVHIWNSGNQFRSAVNTQGIPDDSILGDETVLVSEPTEGGWHVTEIWHRWRCARGENRGEWTNKPCP